MADFKYRDSVEGWVEGIFDSLDAFLRTVLLLNLRPMRMLLRLATTDGEIPELSRPSSYLVAAYIVMSLLIVRVDFTDPFFSINLAARLDVLGVLNAAKSLKPEALVLSIFPAVGLLFAFVYISQAVLRALGDPLDTNLLRRNYSYMLGSSFLCIGVTSGGYQLLVKPLLARSWWLGLPVHLATVLSLVGVIVPQLAIQLSENGATQAKPLARLVATIVPLVVLMILLRLLSGSFYLMDYLRLRH